MQKLSDLKPKDKVFWSNNYNMGIHTIARITKTQIISTNNSKYNRNTGRLIGSKFWNTQTIRVLTPELKNNFLLVKSTNKLKHMIENINIPKTQEKINELINIIEPHIKK